MLFHHYVSGTRRIDYKGELLNEFDQGIADGFALAAEWLGLCEFVAIPVAASGYLAALSVDQVGYREPLSTNRVGDLASLFIVDGEEKAHCLFLCERLEGCPFSRESVEGLFCSREQASEGLYVVV